MANIKIRGDKLSAVRRTHGATLDQLADGSWEGTVTFFCLWNQVHLLAPRRFVTQHPDFTSLTCSDVKCVQLRPGVVGRIVATYRGLLDPDVEPTEEITVNTGEAPIETHDKFVTVLGGVRATPKNGAIFDAEGKFAGWKADSKFAGVTAYLSPGTIYRVSKPQTERPTSIAGVGKPGTLPTPIDLPNQFMGWLLISMSWTRTGAIYLVTREFQLSGRKGWDVDIYG